MGEGRRAAAARSRMHLDGMAGARSRTGGGGVLTGGGVASDAGGGRGLRGGGGHGAGSEVIFFFFLVLPLLEGLTLGLGLIGGALCWVVLKPKINWAFPIEPSPKT